MAWEWVAPVATGTLGIAGMYFTWLTAKQARDHDRALATEARQQQRLEKTYVDLLDLAERAGQCVQLVLPVVDVGQPQPPLPTLEEQARVEAAVKAFGSAEVRTRMESWRRLVIDVSTTVDQIHFEEADPRRPSERSPRLDLEDLRREERTARAALAEQMAAELADHS